MTDFIDVSGTTNVEDLDPIEDDEVLEGVIVDDGGYVRELHQVVLGFDPYVLITVTPNEAHDDVDVNLSAGGFPGPVTRSEIAELLENMAGELRLAEERESDIEEPFVIAVSSSDDDGHYVRIRLLPADARELGVELIAQVDALASVAP